MRVHIDRVLLTFWRAAVEFVADRGHRAAAQVAFFALLSVVPLALLLVAVLGLAFEDDEVRRRVVGAVFDNVSLAAESDRARLERALTDSLDGAGSLNVVSIVLLLVAATGVTSGLRYAVNQAWDFEESLRERVEPAAGRGRGAPPRTLRTRPDPPAVIDGHRSAGLGAPARARAPARAGRRRAGGRRAGGAPLLALVPA